MEITLKNGTREYEVAQTPTEGLLFEVNPLGIDRSMFEKRRSDQRQEWTRQIIQEAFDEVDKYPEKYASAFYTLMPEKKWKGNKTVEEHKAYANYLGGKVADWVEQALEWAQRIFNGESWEEVCNNADTANWYRMIIWKHGYARLVGGSRYFCNYYPASDVSRSVYSSNFRLDRAVPLVVIRKQ